MKLPVKEYRPHPDTAEQNQQDSGDDTGDEAFSDGCFGRDPIKNHGHAGRDENTERTAMGNESGCQCR